MGKEVCGVVSCRRKVGGSSARCFGCKQALLCGIHKGVLCTACDEPANEAPAAQPSNALPSHFPTMLTCLMPGGGELLTAHYVAVPFDASLVPRTPARRRVTAHSGCNTRMTPRYRSRVSAVAAWS